MTKQPRQFGTWSSLISAKMVATGARLGDVQWDTTGETRVETLGETLVWLESREGRSMLLAQSGTDAPRELNGPEISVKGRVGYGGGAFTVMKGVVYFAGSKGRLYRVALDGGKPRPITPDFGAAAAPRVSADGKWIVYAHTYNHVDGLALVDTNGEHWPRKLAFGTDFVMQPTWHPGGKYLAYITWNHPQMPWDGTRLNVATLGYDHADVPFIQGVDVITGDTNTAIFQPEFSPDGRYLSYISNATGFGQIYLYDIHNGTHTQLTDTPAEHLIPAWVQGMRMMAWQPEGQGFYFLRNTRGFYSLHHYNIQHATETPITALEQYTHMEQLSVSQSGQVALIAAASQISPRVITYHPETPNTSARIHSRAGLENIATSALSKVEAITWQGHDGDDVHGLYYPPTHERYEGVGAPPLIVIVHGGPTSQKTADYESEAQFFATRGFAVLYPNHRGSTGYGKPYMDKLRGNWGVYDVEDSATGAQHLVKQGLADASRLVIMGGSAGGFTTLQSLVDKPGFYKAGICRYGIGNQFMLVMDTHKFEERYSETLLGALPDAAETYRARSPLFHVDKISDPVLIFQGEDDVVVPKNQSDSMVASLQARGIPHEYHVYAGEGHGFQKAETLTDYYNRIMAFLMQYVLYA